MLGLSPRPSTNDFQITWFRALRIAIRRLLVVVLIIGIRDPLRHIPGHVIQPIGASPGLERSRRRQIPKPVFTPIDIRIGTASYPALRLGWIQASPAPMPRLLASGALISGGNFNHFASHVVRKILEAGELDAFVATLRARYAERAQAMDAALRKQLAGVVRWEKPGGGYFFWLELPEGADAATFEAAARAAGTGFLPGSACTNAGGLRHCLRLSFAHYSVTDIHEGIARMRRALIS